ncbi:hypothetical protein D3C80_1168570 [compost metagenome]
MEVGAALQHLAQVAGLLAGPQQAQRHGCNQVPGLQRIGQWQPFAHPLAGLAQALGCCAAEQAAGHAHGGEDGNAALQQDAQRAVEARQFVHHQALVQCRQAPQLAGCPAPHPWLAAQQPQRRDRAEGAQRQRQLLGMQEQADLHQQPRQPGQLGAHALEYLAETRHHVAKQEQHHATAHQQ